MQSVLYITHDGLLDPLGESQILPYLSSLSSKFNISVLSYEKKDKLNSKEYLELRTELNKKCIDYYYLHFLPKHFLPWQIIAGFVKALIIIKKKKIDFVHSRGFVASIIALLLKKTINTPFIFDMRGFWVEERIELEVLKKGLFYRSLKKIEKLMMNNTSQIVVLTKVMKEELIKKYNIKTLISVIPTCVDLNIFKLKKRNISKRLKLIYFGSCGERYNLDKTIHFFKILEKNIHAELTLIINNPEKLEKNIISEINQNNKIFLLKKQPQKKLSKILNKHHFSIFFLNVPLSGKGVFPTRLGESLACGLPVITNSGIGDCDIIFKKNNIGVLIDNCKNESEIIDKIKKLIKNPLLANNCRAFARRYLDLKKGVAHFVSIYNSVRE